MSLEHVDKSHRLGVKCRSVPGAWLRDDAIRTRTRRIRLWYEETRERAASKM